MSDWMHCNKCLRKIDPRLKFFIKECGRLECQKCLNTTGEGESHCVACNKSDKTILLANNMKPEVQNYFKPIPQLLDDVKKAYEFQLKHRKNLITHVCQKYQRAKDEVARCYQTIDMYKKDIERLKAMLQGGPYSTPGAFSASTPIQHSKASPSPFNGSLSTVTCTPRNSYSRPGHVHRISPLDNKNSSTASSLEHVVPGGWRYSSVVVPTHKSKPQTPVSMLMSQMLQNQHFKKRPL